MTQERLPRVWDAVHVFFVAFGLYFLVSTIGMEAWRFFLALALFQVLAGAATVYNANILAQSLGDMSGWRILQWNILLSCIGFFVYSGSAWASRQDMLHSGVETFIGVCFILINIAWTYLFYRKWSRLVEGIS
jgi:hypothetical protein